MDVLTTIGLNHYLTISVLLFGFGLFAIITRKNAIVVLMGVELILNAANINLLAFSKFNGAMEGVMFSLFVIVLAAAEAAVALAIVINIYKTFNTVDVSRIDSLKE
ncbi:NADH-quinone oxidoreductase subunit NuoK [Prosthecochloris sp. N3]|uniref:NADH-quinone oxidoreductase subunit K n=1 Tax=Prosthecochloris ethylica TaxID=2743976 RepID=A0ABR9XSF5_9CHLB|nr:MULTISPECIES: NADH-quinone oxidoreductase subunit NuoK [Prosthecochloris]MEC9487574.1 NADH-quinone oxidoreductase subunit NuoK [Prosthecochloris sp.]MBF0586656.1 NADH-quinone oxidoreductase subunit NuoK [Prosthecochloris ethylica]MBF0636990.1 NADH-quinone oxidoreductase subunit NuoK [Prosthecochloris ethylica]NUK47861.1 NADH-quinone oxidoreductase subunit NuoK [Prosthecochloris ethylica]RNA65095.1 NADH-quinone oxidoreductase subunit NuoK [Prosthecochloris sp. ZM_2]